LAGLVKLDRIFAHSTLSCLPLVLEPAQDLIGTLAAHDVRRESCGQGDETNESHREDHRSEPQGDGNPKEGIVESFHRVRKAVGGPSVVESLTPGWGVLQTHDGPAVAAQSDVDRRS
jgi:hypothetical protein